MSPMSRRPSRKAVSAAALAAAISLSAVGCSALNPGGSGDAAVSAAGAKLTDDQIKGAGNVTLHLSDYQIGGMLNSLKQAIAGFEKKFPNVTIVRADKSFADYGKTIALSMSSDSAPDIAQSNAAMAPRLVGASLLKPLDAYSAAYGWNAAYPSGIKAGLKLSADGKTFGAGKQWGMAIGGNLVGLYYNKDLLKKIGASAPASFDDLVAAMQKAKDAGITALEVGNLDQAQAGHIASTLMSYYQSPASLNDWINGVSGSDIRTAGNTKALTTLKDWVDKGYISSDANGIKEDDGAADFAAGNALFDITGSWRSTQFDTALGDRGGFMTLPGSSVNKAPATGWFSEGWTISSKSKNPDIAAAFLNYMYGPSSVDNNIVGGYLPFAPGATTPGKAVAKDVLANWYRVSEANGNSGYLDSGTPSMGTTEFPALQSLLAGKKTPTQVLEAMQADWTGYHGKG